MKLKLALLVLISAYFVRSSFAGGLTVSVPLLQGGDISDPGFLSFRAAKIMNQFQPSEIIDIDTKSRIERFYQKKNGRLYRFRYTIKDGKVVYEEEECNKDALIQTYIESQLQLVLNEAQVASVVAQDLPLLTEGYATPNDSALSVPSGNLIIELAWVRQVRNLSLKAAKMNSHPSGSRPSGTHGKTKTEASDQKPVTVTRTSKGRIVKPPLRYRITGKTRKVLKEKTRKDVIRLHGNSFESDKDSSQQHLIDVYRGLDTDTFLAHIHICHDLEDIVAEASRLGLLQTLNAVVKPSTVIGLTNKDWEGLCAFDDMLRGIPLAGDITFKQLQNWLNKKRRLRMEGGGLYLSLADAYVDLCLQFLALKHWMRALFVESEWNSFYNASRNQYVHIQQFFQNNLNASWDFFVTRRSYLVTKLTKTIKDADTRKLNEIRESLRKATGLQGGDFPEYLFARP